MHNTNNELLTHVTAAKAISGVKTCTGIVLCCLFFAVYAKDYSLCKF